VSVASAGPYANYSFIFAPCCRQITTPLPHHSLFPGRMPFLSPSPQCQSIEDNGSNFIKETTAAAAHFDGRFPGEPGFSPPQLCFLHFIRKRTFGICGTGILWDGCPSCHPASGFKAMQERMNSYSEAENSRCLIAQSCSNWEQTFPSVL